MSIGHVASVGGLHVSRLSETERGYSPGHFLGISLYVREMRRMTIGAIMRRFSVGKWEVWAIRFGAGWPSKILFRRGQPHAGGLCQSVAQNELKFGGLRFEGEGWQTEFGHVLPAAETRCRDKGLSGAIAVHVNCAAGIRPGTLQRAVDDKGQPAASGVWA